MNLSNWHQFDSYTIERHHLEGILFTAQIIDRSDERYSQLFRTWTSQWRYNQMVLACLKSLDEGCQAAKLECVLLKGAGLLLRYYPDLGARKISDIDLLITTSEVEKFEQLFDQLGFKKVAEPAWWGEKHKSTWQMTVEGECLVLELHWQLFYGNKLDWKNKPMNYLTNFRHIKLLSPELEFCYLVAHYATQHNFQKLFWLYDLSLFIQKEKLDWSEVKRLSEELGVKRAVQMVLYLLRQEFKLEISYQPGKTWWQGLLNRAVYVEGKRNLTYWLLKHLSKDSFWLALKYDLLWFFHQIKKRLQAVKE